MLASVGSSLKHSFILSLVALLAMTSSATAANAAGVTLAWDAPVSQTPALSYRVYSYDKKLGATSAKKMSDVAAKSLTVDNISTTTSYCFFVKAVFQGNVEGDASNTVCLDAAAAPTSTPTPTPTSTPAPPRTPSPTKVPVPPTSPTPTSLPTKTASPTRTSSPTKTAAPTRTSSATPTPAPVQTPRPPSPTLAPAPIAAPPVTPPPSSNPARGNTFVGLNIDQRSLSTTVLGLSFSSDNGETQTTYVRDTVGQGRTDHAMRGLLPVPGDYDGDGAADLATLDLSAQGFTLRILPSRDGVEKALAIRTSLKRIVSGCDFTGDGRSDIILLPRNATHSKARVISETNTGTRSTRLSLGGTATSAKRALKSIVAGSCFDTNGDSIAELVLITQNSQALTVSSGAKASRTRNSLLVISRSGEILSQTLIKGQANGILPVPLETKGTPVIGYYNRANNGLVSRVSFVMNPREVSSIISLKIPASSDLGSGIVATQTGSIPGLLVYTASSQLKVLNLMDIKSGYTVVNGLPSIEADTSRGGRLAIAPRSHFLARK